jgi:hypothetical protein
MTDERARSRDKQHVPTSGHSEPEAAAAPVPLNGLDHTEERANEHTDAETSSSPDAAPSTSALLGTTNVRAPGTESTAVAAPVSGGNPPPSVAAKTPPLFVPELYSFHELQSRPVRDPDWLLEDLIAEASRSIIYGPWASLKSWLLADMALCLSGAIPWLDHFKVPRPFCVVYLDEENGIRRTQSRIRRQADGLGLLGKPLPLHFAPYPGLKFKEGIADKLLSALWKDYRVEPDVLIFETFRRIFGGNENDAGDVAEFWGIATEFTHEGKAIAVSHHSRKPRGKNESSKHTFAGSSDIPGGADVSLSVIRPTHDTVRIEQYKNRDALEPDPIFVRFLAGKTGPVRFERMEAPPKDAAGKGAGSEKIAEVKARAYCIDNPESLRKEVVEHLEEEGVSKTTANRIATKLADEGLCERERADKAR